MSIHFDASEHSHRRFNALSGDWVLVSPHRAKRPWQGKTEIAAPIQRSHHDPSCYLCPGNARTSGEKNPDYQSTFVFTNDHAPLQQETPVQSGKDPLFTFEAEQGIAKVICYSPNHSLTLAELPAEQIEAVVACWVDEDEALADDYLWVQIFENKGELMGCSMPHPHGQIWAQKHLPTLAEKELRQQRNFLQQYNEPLLLEYARRELALQERIVVDNEDWLVVVPYWAAWPFETLLLPRKPLHHLRQLNSAQKKSLADILQRITTRYDNLFCASFPYSMGWHSAPNDGDPHREWMLHAHFFPPLLRSATVKKFMVGYELLSETQRDITPEQAAAQLRALDEIHYKNKLGGR